MIANEKMSTFTHNDKASHWEAFLNSLPFAVFGVVCMIGKVRVPWVSTNVYLAFYFFVLFGLLIGLVKAFPRWAYSYLGWSMVMSWWWMTMPVDTFSNSYSPVTHNQLLGWWSWTPLLITIGIGLLSARSFRPLRQMILGIWQDWTLASFMMYTFVAFVLLIYDENHHPYLFLFMTASTIILSAGAWLFLRSGETRKRVASLLAGFVLAFTVLFVCESTWDWHAYYGYPKQPAGTEYMSAVRFGVFLAIYGVILFLPALVGLTRSAINKSKPA